MATLVGEEVRPTHYDSSVVLILLSGKTTCLGQRLARVELKIVTALFLLGFRHCVVDGSGKTAQQSPLPNWNDILLCRPPQGSFRLRYERTNAAL